MRWLLITAGVGSLVLSVSMGGSVMLNLFGWSAVIVGALLAFNKRKRARTKDAGGPV